MNKLLVWFAFISFSITALEMPPKGPRCLTSLAEAVMFGKFDITATKEITFADFDPTTNKTAYSMNLPEVNGAIYFLVKNCLKPLSEEEQQSPNSTHPLALSPRVTQKIKRHPSASLTDMDWFVPQSVRFSGFMSVSDLEVEKIKKTNAIMDDEKIAERAKPRLIETMQDEISRKVIQRMLYLAAIASQDVAAITEEKAKEFRCDLLRSLVADIDALREDARNAAQDPIQALSNCRQQ